MCMMIATSIMFYKKCTWFSSVSNTSGLVHHSMVLNLVSLFCSSLVLFYSDLDINVSDLV